MMDGGVGVIAKRKGRLGPKLDSSEKSWIKATQLLRCKATILDAVRRRYYHTKKCFGVFYKYTVFVWRNSRTSIGF